jgi:hypothetical protein
MIMNIRTAEIPYERQSEPQTNRMCGAASLSMVYGSFGQRVPQAEIWPRIAKKNNLGSLTSATYLMAQDALSRGYSALAIQARQPLQVLRICRDNGIRAVLNHRIREDGESGHYTVLVDIDEDSVVLHDPDAGPSRRVSHATLLELFRPNFPNPEITGNMLIGIATEAPPRTKCHLCGTPIPAEVRCSVCDKPIALQPAMLLGCVAPVCDARTWTHLCCPQCDYTWAFAVQSKEQLENAESADGFPNFERVFSEIDRFCQIIRSMPGLAKRQDVLEHLSYLTGTRERLRAVQIERLAHRRASLTRIADLEAKARRDEETLENRKEELRKAAGPVDGNDLARALLKDLGLLQGSTESGRSPSRTGPARS